MEQAAIVGSVAFFNPLFADLPACKARGLVAGIALAQYRCGLATVTSASRMYWKASK